MYGSCERTLEKSYFWTPTVWEFETFHIETSLMDI